MTHDSEAPARPFSWLADGPKECPKCGGDASAIAHDAESCLQGQVDRLTKRCEQLDLLVRTVESRLRIDDAGTLFVTLRCNGSEVRTLGELIDALELGPSRLNVRVTKVEDKP